MSESVVNEAFPDFTVTYRKRRREVLIVLVDTLKDYTTKPSSFLKPKIKNNFVSRAARGARSLSISNY